MTIPKEVKDILQQLEAANFQAFVVGGCVRDLLLKREPKDWDIATNATPEEIQKIFPDSFYENTFGTVGVKIKNNAMKSKQPVLERIFDEEAGKIGVGVGRTRCIFAYPRNPESIHNRLGFDPRTDILVEAMINSETAMVANAEYYTEAASRLEMGENAAREWAKIYWQEVKPLRQYLAEGHSGSEDDDSDFAFPEVLIPEDIPVTRLRIAKVQPET